jgi:predicted HicB family RNase H-like nuclease
MGYLHYKGYNGSVEYSEDDRCLCGKILGLKNSLILYEGNSLDELQADFEAGVENYLERCIRKGVEPETPYNGVLNINISSDTHVKIAMFAEHHRTSIDALISDLIEKRMETA